MLAGVNLSSANRNSRFSPSNPQRPTPDPQKPPVVTVFGSSRAEHDSPEYRQAYQLGKLLAEAGYVVCNGGYSGTMEAASRGCKDAGGRTIGVTGSMRAGAPLSLRVPMSRLRSAEGSGGPGRASA